MNENQKKMFNQAPVEMLLTISASERKLTKNDLVNMTSIKTYNTVQTHADMLIGMKLIDTEKKGKYVLLSLTGKGKKTIEQIKVLFDILK